MKRYKRHFEDSNIFKNKHIVELYKKCHNWSIGNSWEDFYRRNKKIIDNEVQKIKDVLNIISDSRRRIINFKYEMEQLNFKLAGVYELLKNN